MKKMIQVLLALCMTMVLLTGCNSKKEEKDTVSTGIQTETTDKNQNEKDDASPGVVIKMVLKDMSADDEVSVKFLEKVSEGVSNQLGREVKIELAPISEGTYSESLGLLIQSGEIPDLMYFQGGDYQFAITQGILEDLIPYIEESTYVKAMIQPYNKARLENYPYLLWLAPDRIKVPVVRQDWLDGSETGKALLENTTPENYKAFFKELVKQHNLLSAYTVPGDVTELDTVFNLAFGVTQTWVMEGDSYVYSKVSQAAKDKLGFYAELYKEGLLDNEWISKKWDTKESAFYNGEVGVVAGTQGNVVNVYNNKMVGQNGESAKLAVLPPAKGVAQGYTPSDVSKESRGWAINSYSGNKDVAFAILEYMASPEGQILDKIGYEGEHYIKEGEQYKLTDKIGEWWPRFHESIYKLDVNFVPETPYYSEAAEKALDMVIQYSSFDNSFVIPDEYATNWDAQEALYAEFAAEVINGNRSIDEFDSYVKEWYALGGTEMTEYANEVLNK